MTDDEPTTLQGLWVPIITPLDGDGEVDLRALERLAARLLADGARGLVALGTTGEPATLTPSERRSVVEACDRACRAAGRGLIVGAGGNSTAATIAEVEALTACTSALGALVVVPYYTRPSEAAIVEHFITVADASRVPLLVYNVPYRTGRGLGAASLLELSAHPRIIGLKQSVAALDLDTLQVLASSGPDFAVLCGDDAFIAPTVLMGGAGAIAAAAHLCTPQFVELVDSALAGDPARASDLAAALLPLIVAGFSEPNPSGWKGALARSGEIASDELRRPMTPASPAAVDRLLDASWVAA